jgi:hypothetical protein
MPADAQDELQSDHQRLFAEIDHIFRETRRRGVILEGLDPRTGEEITYQVIQDEQGNEQRIQLFPPPVATPRPLLHSYDLTWLGVMLLCLSLLGLGYLLLRVISGGG